MRGRARTPYAMKRGHRARPLAAAIAAAWLVGCGASAGQAHDERPDPSARVAEAAAAWGALDAARAARLADDALTLGAGEDAREIAARAHLAIGATAPATRALEGVTRPDLLRLRARAQLAALDLDGAVATLEAAARRSREEDPWTTGVLPALRAAAERGAPYVVDGRDAELTLTEAPLPLVRVRVDAVETLALVGSGAYLAVLDPSVRAAPGAIDELTLGGVRVRNVPHVVRPLEDVRAALGVDVGMVIGADLLRRLHAVVDGPAGKLELASQGATPREGASRATSLMLTGSFLALEVQLGRAPAWLTVDTAGLFTIALTPSTVEALGIESSEWQASAEGPAIWVAPEVRLGSLQVEQIPLIRGLLDESHARAVAAPVAGSVGWALLSQLRTRFAADALYFE